MHKEPGRRNPETNARLRIGEHPLRQREQTLVCIRGVSAGVKAAEQGGDGARVSLIAPPRDAQIQPQVKPLL